MYLCRMSKVWFWLLCLFFSLHLSGQLLTGVLPHDCEQMLTATSTKEEGSIKLRQAWGNSLGFTCRRKIRWEQMNFSWTLHQGAPSCPHALTHIFSLCAQLIRDLFPALFPIQLLCAETHSPVISLGVKLSLPPSCKVPG